MKGRIASVIIGVIIVIVEIVILVNNIDYNHPEHNSILIIQFMIFMGIGSALISYGARRRG
ncbi:hypothetical protein [Mesoaciditoga lauensis]|uniref:hypothetical protein n=1 Tax=Mesoaciditoga lauensis TaxID=1495039 RepID=UPI00055A6DB8|nr:hypothetical protein [Mesoaciditoga lauensis]